MEAFDLERCGNATMALGQASGALETGCLRPATRAVRNRWSSSGSDPAGGDVDPVDAARLLIHRAVVNAENRRAC
jgi:butyryl-CoA dehydrogenase